MSYWISVEDRMPEVNESVIVCCKTPWGSDVFDGHRYRKAGFVRDDYFSETAGVTHWMPLPEPPK